MDERLRILLIDDDEDEYFLLRELVSGQAQTRRILNYDLEWVSNYEDALQAFRECRYELYLVDYHLGRRSGLDLLREPAVRECAAPVIMLTGQGSYQVDLSAMQLGVADYLEKGQLTLPLLERSILYAIERKQAEKNLESLIQERTRDLALLQKQAQELNALQKATSSLLHTLDLPRLMGQILDAALEAIATAEHGTLYLVDRDHGAARQLMKIAFDDPRIQKVKPFQNLHTALQAIRDGHSLLISDVQAEPGLHALAGQQASDARSAIFAPLMLGQEILGALTLSSSRPFVFSEADLRLLTSFAATATAAIHNAILYRETEDLATTDPLTGQLNRRTFFELCQREIERFQRFGRPLSWIMFDVDLFKEVNDRYGHAVGDQVLLAIAERCARLIRHVDLFGRYGGDEFVILLPETEPENGILVAKRLCQSILDYPIQVEAGLITLTPTIGVASVTNENRETMRSLSQLLNCADKALYAAKKLGRGQVQLYPKTG